jgi:hypothetical protein
MEGEDIGHEHVQRHRRNSLVKIQQVMGRGQYEGDHFGTRGDYSAGMIYQFRSHSSAIEIPVVRGLPSLPALRTQRSHHNKQLQYILYIDISLSWVLFVQAGLFAIAQAVVICRICVSGRLTSLD